MSTSNDYAELRAALDAGTFCDNDFGAKYANTIRKLLDERDALARDAERYRWLRDSDATTGPGVFQTDLRGSPVEWLEGDQLDAAIDEAMRGGEGVE
jgi:hypothetical protein